MRARAASLVSLALLCSCSAFSWEHDADHLIESALNITRGHGAGAHSRDLYLPPPSLCWLRRSAARRAARPTRPSPRCVWLVLTSAGGECAIGVGCGVVAGWLFRKLQGAIVTAAVVGALGTGLALHQNWVRPLGCRVSQSVVDRS
uniref:Uncharacterized protein n=1 Tax=Emiliania huxleyi TaxID=2903 RepID=A0A6V2RK05_EMIHU